MIPPAPAPAAWTGISASPTTISISSRAGETLTVNYNVKVSDASTSATQTVSVVITGANDAVVDHQRAGIGVRSPSRPNTIGSSSLDSTSPTPTGTLAFTDVDLTDTHSVSVALDLRGLVGRRLRSVGHAERSAGGAGHRRCTIPPAPASGGIDWTFSIPDKDLDFLGCRRHPDGDLRRHGLGRH